MHPSLRIVRTLTKAGSLLALVLLFASTAEAAHGARRGSSRRTCDPHTTNFRQLPRHPKSFGGPLAQPSQRVLAGLTDPMTRMARATHTDDDDDDEAIQNDAPAARIDNDARSILGLRPLGLLTGSFDQQAHTRAFTPKSPRGPPRPV
jgi:hypothetical protein